MTKFVNEFVHGILAFQYNYTNVAFFDNHVTFNTPSGTKTAYIQEVPYEEDRFIFNGDTLALEPTVFQFTPAHIRVFRRDSVTELIEDNDELVIEHEVEGYFSIPLLVVKNKITEIEINEHSI